MSNSKPILAWHFTGATLRDGRPLPPDGEWLTHDGQVSMCRSGLHASRKITDALQYAPGATICRVECEDVVAEDSDKLVCRRRRILWRVDGLDLLRDFARRCALDVIHLWDASDVAVRYLKTGDESLRAAARAVAWAAVLGAAGDAGDAARAAARAAVWGAAGDAGDAARAKQARRLEAMVHHARRRHHVSGKTTPQSRVHAAPASIAWARRNGSRPGARDREGSR